MNGLIGKTPFFRLLLPLIAGIAAMTLLPGGAPLIPFFTLTGLTLMLLSFIINEQQQYRFRWLFGAGLFFFLFALSAAHYYEQEKRVHFSFPAGEHSYMATILDIPETKRNSIACNVKIAPPFGKKIVLYLAQTDEARSLLPGDEILFSTRLQRFQNFGNPDDFDYVRYMKIKGFTASGYVPANNWIKSGRASRTIPIRAQRIRKKALTLFRSYLPDQDAFAFISAITLGYKAYLSDDLQDAFRASGTAHVLAVSGLHVGIIYLIINLLFSFLGNYGMRYILRQWLVICVLWGYVFMAGMSSSVIRAAIMLTIMCLGNMKHRRGFTFNTLAAAAFFILIFQPFSLFDVSFQMSFGAVFAILYFQPRMKACYTPKNRVVKYIWELFTVSTSAQLGVFPLVLYYFGTFPTYFFITNLLVVPIVGIIMYAIVPLMLMTIPGIFHTGLIGLLQELCKIIVLLLTKLTLRIVSISESLPFAQLSGGYLSLLQLVLLLSFVYLIAGFLYTHHHRYLILSLALLLMFQLTITHAYMTQAPSRLIVFNSPGTSEIGMIDHHKRRLLDVPDNGLLPHPQKSILRLSDGSFNHYVADFSFPLDILIFSKYSYFDVQQLQMLFNPAMIVLDSSLPRYAADRIKNECIRLNIGVHDVTQNGALSVNF